MTVIYQNYDRVALDAQYNVRQLVKDFQQCLDRWATESMATLARLPHDLDIPFGASPRERLDIFHPPGPRIERPVFIFFHGGYWRALSKADHRFVAAMLATAGMVVALPDYDLCPGVTLDQLVQQCRDAVVWIARYIGNHDGDPQRLFLSGHSAGAHIVAMMLATDWSRSPEVASGIRGATLISGLYDLEPLQYTFLQPDLNLNDGLIARNSPSLLKRTVGAPVVLAVGSLETAEFKRQTRSYAEACRKDRVACREIELFGRHHYTALEALGSRDTPLRLALLEQMNL
jgi:arylformamidase